jgi:pimeloyl-[acyl-carrier protein] methyl ester esterase
MSTNTVMILSGWAHAGDSVLSLSVRLFRRFNVKATSVAELPFPGGCTGHTVDSVPGQRHREEYASAFYALCSLAKEPPIIVAWSMGALVALEAITGLALKASGLVIVSGTARFCNIDGYTAGVPEQNLRAMAAAFHTKQKETLKKFLEDASFPVAIPQDVFDDKISKARAMGDTALATGLNYLRKTDMRERLSKISIPTLIIHGKQDRIIPVSAAEFLKSRIPDSRLLVHEDSGHNLILDRPDLVADEIVKFVED